MEQYKGGRFRFRKQERNFAKVRIYASGSTQGSSSSLEGKFADFSFLSASSNSFRPRYKFFQPVIGCIVVDVSLVVDAMSFAHLHNRYKCMDKWCAEKWHCMDVLLICQNCYAICIRVPVSAPKYLNWKSTMLLFISIYLSVLFHARHCYSNIP